MISFILYFIIVSLIVYVITTTNKALVKRYDIIMNPASIILSANVDAAKALDKKPAKVIPI